MAQCKFIKPDGIQCEANAIHDSDFCFSHDPKSKEEKVLAVIKGGLNRRLREAYLNKPVPIKTPQDIKELLAEVINSVLCGEMPASQPANSIGFLSRCWLDAHQASEVEQRLKVLEKRVEKAGL